MRHESREQQVLRPTGEAVVQVGAHERVRVVLDDDRLALARRHPVDDGPVLAAHVVQAALAVVVLDVDDRDARAARAVEQLRRLVEGGLHADELHGPAGVGVLAVDQDERRLGERDGLGW